MADDDMRQRAPNLLAHYVPAEVLRKADELARQFEREEAFRVYLLKRMWLVIPAALLLLAATIYPTGLLVNYMKSLLPADTPWADAAAAAAVLVIGFGGFFVELYLIFRWLERRALRQDDI